MSRYEEMRTIETSENELAVRVVYSCFREQSCNASVYRLPNAGNALVLDDEDNLVGYILPEGWKYGTLYKFDAKKLWIKAEPCNSRDGDWFTILPIGNPVHDLSKFER